MEKDLTLAEDVLRRIRYYCWCLELLSRICLHSELAMAQLVAMLRGFKLVSF